MPASSNLIDRAKAVLRPFFMETSYVAEVYGDSMRDHFVGFAPLDPQRFGHVKAEFDAERKCDEPCLAKFLEIESALLEFLPDSMIIAKFWSIDDRFQRVVPATTRTNYEKSVPPRGDVKWTDATFVRNQARILLDVIHSNYLINIGREKSIKRLKTVILSFFAIATIVTLCTVLEVTQIFVIALALLTQMGVAGAILSISLRLQTAVSRDAMTDDGIYELTGLRLGWVGIVLSIIMGGAFALVMYAIVMAGVLNVAYPVTAADMVATADTAPAAPPQTSPPHQPVTHGSSRVALSPDTGPVITNWDGKFDDLDGEKLGEVLGLKGRTSFYKMLILAFLAGFAERLVPDILGRLSKKG